MRWISMDLELFQEFGHQPIKSSDEKYIMHKKYTGGGGGGGDTRHALYFQVDVASTIMNLGLSNFSIIEGRSIHREKMYYIFNYFNYFLG